MNSRNKWNTKHKERLHDQMEPVPNLRLKVMSANLNGGTVLDLACGLGGNSLFLARKNYDVQAVDISNVAINYIQEQALIEKLKIHPMVCDLTKWNELNWQNNSFDLVVITYYLDRTLFPFVKRIIKKKGYFFMETYYQSPQNEIQRLSNQYKLQPKELLAEFGDWNVLSFEENELEGRQTIFCQKP